MVAYLGGFAREGILPHLPQRSPGGGTFGCHGGGVGAPPARVIPRWKRKSGPGSPLPHSRLVSGRSGASPDNDDAGQGGLPLGEGGIRHGRLGEKMLPLTGHLSEDGDGRGVDLRAKIEIEQGHVSRRPDRGEARAGDGGASEVEELTDRKIKIIRAGSGWRGID